MKVVRISFLFAALLLLVFSSERLIAQATDEGPRLGDEYPTNGTSCGEFYSRLDLYFNELANSSHGFIVIYGSPRSRTAAEDRKRQVEYHLKIRRFDRSRISIMQGSIRQDPTVQFWIGNRSRGPEMLASEFAEPEDQKEIAYLYAKEWAEEGPNCVGRDFDLSEYAEVLKADTRARGNVVIGETTRRNFEIKEGRIRKELKRLGIVEPRIKAVDKRVLPVSLPSSQSYG